jgi:hypothetical protein
MGMGKQQFVEHGIRPALDLNSVTGDKKITYMAETVVLLDIQHQVCVIVSNQFNLMAFFQCATGLDCGGPIVYCLGLC